MTRISRISVTALAAGIAALMLAVPAVMASSGTRIALKASNAFPGATGHATLKGGGERELEVEVQHVRRLAGKTVVVTVGSKRVGSMRVNGLGHATLRREGAGVPALARGTSVKVRTAAGTLVVSGIR